MYRLHASGGPEDVVLSCSLTWIFNLELFLWVTERPPVFELLLISLSLDVVSV